MSEKITTDLMREWYVRSDHSGTKSRKEYEAEFDSWLAAHDDIVRNSFLERVIFFSNKYHERMDDE